MTELPALTTSPVTAADLVAPAISHLATAKPPVPTIPYSWRTIHPNAQFHYIRHHEEANNALEGLNDGVYGFDLEWKPTFKRGQPENPVSLVQIANHEVILVLQVTAMREFPSKLREFLENPNFGKAGAGIQGDTKKLYRDWQVDVCNCVDLSLLARTVDNREWRGRYTDPLGLARMIAVYENRLLRKGKITRSNWEGLLTADQQLYAANDAHAGYIIYLRLMSMLQFVVPQPHTRYYSFGSVRGRLCDPSGSMWQPSNPDYDPGPPPPPRGSEPQQKLHKDGGASTVGQSSDTSPAPPLLQPSSSFPRGAAQQRNSREPRGNNSMMHIQSRLSQMPTQGNSRQPHRTRKKYAQKQLSRALEDSKTSSSRPAELGRRESSNP